MAEDRAHHRAYAIRAAWLEQGGAPYLASLRLDQAASWAEFREACRYFHRPVREHGLGRSRRPHRLAGGGPGAASPGVGRAPAGAGRRALRVGRVPAGAGPAAPGRPAPGLDRHRPTRTTSPGLSLRGQLPVDRAVPVRADRGGARLGAAADDDRLDAAPAGRAVAAGAVPGADAPGPEAGPGRHGRRGRAAAGLGLRDGQGLDPRGDLRDVGAAPEAVGPRPDGAGRGAAAGVGAVAVDREGDRLADGPRRPLRRRPDRRRATRCCSARSTGPWKS